MRADDLLDAIGKIDDESILDAKQIKKSKKRTWITIVSVAACLVLFFLIPNIPNFIGYNSSDDRYTEMSSTEMILAYDYIDVYYIENNTIKSEKVYLPCSPEDIFYYWRDKNGIGEEVRFIKVKIESNSKTTVSQFQGENVVEHQIGDYHVYNLTISKNFKNYYKQFEESLLLEALEKTMKYNDSMNYNEFNIYFE